jgi:DNA-binding NarL/FixJ family response regulator
MPDMNGYETVAWMRENYPDIRILVVSMVETEESIIKMISMKVRGYLSKNIEVEDIHAALDAIMTKGFYYSDAVSVAMAQNIGYDAGEETVVTDTIGAPPHVSSYLKQKELEFLNLAATQLTYQEIAEKMLLSPKTIDGYRESLFQRFNVTNRVTLVVYAIKHGLIKI